MKKMEDAKITDFKKCPHCGSEFGYFTTVFASGWLTDTTCFNGDKENTNMHDSLSYSRESKYYKCSECKKRICKVSPKP